jgi:branched-chain amino acid transport system permease protein
LVSVGQQGLVGVSAYTLFVLAEKNGIDPFLSIVLAGVFVAVLSIPIALFAFRLTGGYFAIGTWVIAEVLRLTTLRIHSLGAGNVQSLTVKNTFDGYSLQSRKDLIYWTALILGVGATLIVVAVLRSRLGLALQAVRDNEAGARGLGVNGTRTKLIVWIIASFWTGMTGALIHLYSATITNKDAFDVLSWTAIVVFIVVIGGVGSTLGPVIGVAVYWFITWWLEDADTSRFIVLGATAVLVAVVSRRGVDGLLQKWKPFEIFPIRRRVRPARAQAVAHTSSSAPS